MVFPSLNGCLKSEKSVVSGGPGLVPSRMTFRSMCARQRVLFGCLAFGLIALLLPTIQAADYFPPPDSVGGWRTVRGTLIGCLTTDGHG